MVGTIDNNQEIFQTQNYNRLAKNEHDKPLTNAVIGQTFNDYKSKGTQNLQNPTASINFSTFQNIGISQ